VKLLKQLIPTLARLTTSLKRCVNEKLLFAVVAALLAQPDSARACAACYGQSDSPLASGVTWGILSLLAVVMSVVGSIVTFFVYINRKSAAAAAASQAPNTDYHSPATNH
jgi:hypothetical protein